MAGLEARSLNSEATHTMPHQEINKGLVGMNFRLFFCCKVIFMQLWVNHFQCWPSKMAVINGIIFRKFSEIYFL